MNNFNGLHNPINNLRHRRRQERHRRRQGRLREEEALEQLPRTRPKKLMSDPSPDETAARSAHMRKKKK